MHALDNRLGGDVWFLGSRFVWSCHLLPPTDVLYFFSLDIESSEPTGLDALVFAYIHCLTCTSDEVRREVTQRGNLYQWHRRVKRLVEDGLLPLH